MSKRSHRTPVSIAFALACIATSLAACEPGATREQLSPPDVAVRSAALSSPPEVSCISAEHDGHGYWFCPSNKTWSAARTSCQNVGTDLANIGNASENLFLQANVGLDALIGATDSATEGTWKWMDTNVQFWSGTTFGSAVGGAYTNWDHPFFQPDNQFNQDCGLISALSGLWFDVSCSTTYWYVCEEDLCPTDNAKASPGVCGCGIADVDADADNVMDCIDECPSDASRSLEGDCGCPADPEDEGKPCDDGLCSANDSCDGSGRCGNPTACTVPDSSCSLATWADVSYWFCDNDRSFSDATARCQSAGMELAVVETSQEAAFVDAHAVEHSFIGGSDQGAEGTWKWLSSGKTFWSGNQTGTNIDGAYTNWASGEPSNSLSTLDCVAVKGNGQWKSHSCSVQDAYVCEGVPPRSDSLGECAETVEPRLDLSGEARERAYQAEIQRRCIGPGDSRCLHDLRGRVSLAHTASALALASGSIEANEYLALARDRDRKAQDIETISGRATAVCAGDNDDDLIPTSIDACPSTPPMTPTDDVGCTDSTLPDAPATQDVLDVLEQTTFGFNSACSGAELLSKPSIGGFFKSDDLADGVYVFAGRVRNQPENCPVWYLFDIEEVEADPPGYNVLSRYRVAFVETEETTALLGSPNPVPEGVIQFNAIATDAGSRGQLGATGSKVHFQVISGVRFRVNVMNGGGMSAGWSEWRFTDIPGDCEQLGFDCQ
jgi:hypothetical protein